jgi:hypothetical protein
VRFAEELRPFGNKSAASGTIRGAIRGDFPALTTVEDLMDFADIDSPPARAPLSLRSLAGVHGAAAAVTEVATNSPIVAGVLAIVGAFVLLQFGILAACTHRVTRLPS